MADCRKPKAIMRQFYFLFFILLIIAGCDADTPQDEMDPQLAAQYQKGIDALDVNNFAAAEQAFQACLQIDANAHDGTYVACPDLYQTAEVYSRRGDTSRR